MEEKSFYIVKNMNYKLIAIFTDKEDCIEFISEYYDTLFYDEVVI